MAKKESSLVVVGIYETRSNLEMGVEALRDAGFRSTDVSALFPSTEESKSFAHERSTKAPEGAAAGAASGLALGGVLGWLAGAGIMAIPGVGPLVAAGPIVAALTGAGVGGVVGGVAGSLIGMGIPEHEARQYEGRIKDGGILLSVHCDDSAWADRAEDILASTDATDISRTGDAPRSPGSLSGMRTERRF